MDETKDKDLNFTIPPTLYKIIENEADRLGQTKAALIRQILNDWADSQTERGKLLAKVLSTEAIPEG